MMNENEVNHSRPLTHIVASSSPRARLIVALSATLFVGVGGAVAVSETVAHARYVALEHAAVSTSDASYRAGVSVGEAKQQDSDNVAEQEASQNYSTGYAQGVKDTQSLVEDGCDENWIGDSLDEVICDQDLGDLTPEQVQIDAGDALSFKGHN